MDTTPTPPRRAARHGRPVTPRGEVDALKALWLAKARRLNLPTATVGDRVLRCTGALALCYLTLRILGFVLGLL